MSFLAKTFGRLKIQPGETRYSLFVFFAEIKNKNEAENAQNAKLNTWIYLVGFLIAGGPFTRQARREFFSGGRAG